MAACDTSKCASEQTQRLPRSRLELCAADCAERCSCPHCLAASRCSPVSQGRLSAKRAQELPASTQASDVAAGCEPANTGTPFRTSARSRTMRGTCSNDSSWSTASPPLDDKNLLFMLTQEFANIDLHPDAVPNETMGMVFEELIRTFAETSNETAGEHFTPREVIQLIVHCLFAGDDKPWPSRSPCVRSTTLPRALAASCPSALSSVWLGHLPISALLGRYSTSTARSKCIALALALPSSGPSEITTASTERWRESQGQQRISNSLCATLIRWSCLQRQKTSWCSICWSRSNGQSVALRLLLPASRKCNHSTRTVEQKRSHI